MKIVLFLFCIYPVLLFSQTNTMDIWVGHYEGTMILEFPDGKKDTLIISLDINTIEKGKSWTHSFAYFSKKYGDILKDYTLLLNSKFNDGQHYLLDENNGILIDEIMLNQSLLSHYEVQENYYQTKLERRGNNLYFEIICSKTDGGTTSKAVEKEETFIVTSSLIYTIQYATLIKIN